MDDKLRKIIDDVCRKYEQDQEDPAPYFEGLGYSRYLTYWDYIQSDILLSLQKPVTNIPDEQIFIIYHQITELYFRLILLECEQLASDEERTAEAFKMRIRRMTSYFQQLTRSFAIMTHGMEPRQFLKFRVALTPASGFQSVQFRQIEMFMTPLINLVPETEREAVRGKDIETQYKGIYWKKGAIDTETGRKAMVLRQFEEKYDAFLMNYAIERADNNLNALYHKLESSGQADDELISCLRELDRAANLQWGKVHYNTAKHYLESGGTSRAATGGTNWKKFLPPENQRIMFFPELWSDSEQNNWG